MAKRMEALGARVIFPLQDPPHSDMLKFEGETLQTVCCEYLL